MQLNTYLKNSSQSVLSVQKNKSFIVIVGFWTTWVCTANAADIEITTAETTTQNVPQNQSLTVQSSGSVTTRIRGDDAIIGSNTGEGGNTITLEKGAVVQTILPDDGINDYSHGIQVRGADVDSGVTGLSGGGSLTAEASNIVNMKAGSSISTSGKGSYGIYSYRNNKIVVDGDIITAGDRGYGIYGGRNNEIEANGSVSTTGLNAFGITFEYNNKVNVNGSVTTSGQDAYGIYIMGRFNTLTLNGQITTSGPTARGLQLWKSDNNAVITGTISTSGELAHGIYARNNNNVFNISGTISATGLDSFALYSGYNYGSGESNTFHFLNGSSLTGGIHNADVDDNSTSYLTFGYGKDANNKAVLTSVDNSFSFTLNDSITSDSSGKWDGYFAGGTTFLNGAQNFFRNIFVGADVFDNAAVSDGHNDAGGSQTAHLAPVGSAIATLNITKNVSTDGTVTVGDGSIYNLSGTHTHTGTDLTVSGNGIIDLANGGNLVNNATDGTQSISNLNVSAGTGTLSGNNAIETISNVTLGGALNFELVADTVFDAVNLGGILNNNSANSLTLSQLTVDSGKTGTLSGTNGLEDIPVANVAGTLTYDLSAPLTVDTMNLSGMLNQHSGDSLTLTSFNVASGDTASIAGPGAGMVNLTTANVNGDLNVSRAVTTTGTFTLGADDTYSLSGTHTHTGTDFTANGFLDLNGGTFINNASGGTQTITSLAVSSGSGTLSGSKGLGIVTSADIAGILNYDMSSDLTIDTVNLSGTLNQKSSNALNLTSLVVTSGKTGSIKGVGTGGVAIGTANVNGNLNIYREIVTSGNFVIGDGGTANIHETANITGDTISSGRLHVNGTLNSNNTEIMSSGILSGSGTINNNVVNSGTIAPGNSIGTLTVNDDVTFNSGSSYDAELNRHSSDKLVVNGQVNINGGMVKASPSRKLYRGDERWTIITATNGINGRFDRISGPDSATLSFGLGYSDTTVGIYVMRTPYQTFGNSANDKVVGGVLDTILPNTVNSGTDMEQFLIELDFDYTAAQISEALAALNPELYSSFVDMEFITSQEFAQDIATRMHQLRESKLHLDAAANMQNVRAVAEESNGRVQQVRPSGEWKLWTRTSGSVAENGESEGSGYDIRSGRVSVGGDRQVYEWLLLGAAIGANRSALDYNLGSNSGDQTGMHMALYGDVNYRGFYLNTILSYGDFNNDSERKMNVFSTTAKASFDGTSLAAQVGTGYDFILSKWQIGPVLQVGVARVDVDSLTESGNRAATTLTIDEQSDDYTYGQFGVKAASVYQFGSTSLLPRIGIGVQQTSSNNSDVDAFFSGYQDSMFTVVGADTPESTVGGELGLTALIGDQLSINGKFSSAFGDDYSVYGLSLGLDWRF